jgi:two-component system LytT family sensor kinase
MIGGFLLVWIMQKLFAWFDKKWNPEFSYRRIAKELAYVTLFNFFLQNLLFTPVAAFTDNGLGWEDVADINLIPLLYVLIYYGIVRSNYFLQAYVKNKILLEKITNDKLLTELKFLRAQYHPHFLFNALNTIYFQMDEDVPAAKKSIEKFSELLRYQLYDQQQKVPVQQEITYLQNYIDIQKTRASAKLDLCVHFPETLNGQEIYPLLFLPLVENAFKYVGGDYHLRIEATANGNQIGFEVENSVDGYLPAGKAAGIGLENLSRRLQLLYPQQHQFSVEKKEKSFTARILLAPEKSAYA